MKRVLKWVGIVLGGLLGVIVVAGVVVYFLGGSKLNQTFDVPAVTLAVPTDAASVERGRHLVETIGVCQECHGDDLAGEILDEDLLCVYTDADFVRAIRHGVRPDGTPLVIMPSDYFNRLDDADLGAIIAYPRSLPPVDNEVPSTTIRPLGRLFVLLIDDLLPAQLIDHTAPRPADVEPGVTEAYGEYLATICTVCHKRDFSGGTLPGEGGDAPKAPNLTPASALSTWSEADFTSTLRTGVTPGGKELDTELMPWNRFRDLTDDEIRAIWMYLQSLPAVVGEND